MINVMLTNATILNKWTIPQKTQLNQKETKSDLY